MLQGFKGTDWGDAGMGLLNKIELNWSKPTRWEKCDRRPTFGTDKPILYILLWDHGSARIKDQIVYLGLTKTPRTRFDNHEIAETIVAKRGVVRFTYAPVDLQDRKDLQRIGIGRVLEELEHLLIWAVPEDFQVNKKKQCTLPGMATLAGHAWHVQNTGYRFAGQMPREIVFPWMLVKPGRNPSVRSGHGSGA